MFYVKNAIISPCDVLCSLRDSNISFSLMNFIVKVEGYVESVMESLSHVWCGKKTVWDTQVFP